MRTAFHTAATQSLPNLAPRMAGANPTHCCDVTVRRLRSRADSRAQTHGGVMDPSRRISSRGCFVEWLHLLASVERAAAWPAAAKRAGVCPTSPMRCPARLASPHPRSRSSRERACRRAESADDSLRRGAKHSVGAQERAPPYRPPPRPPLLYESARHPAPRWQCEFALGIREWIRLPSSCHSLASAVVLVRPA